MRFDEGSDLDTSQVDDRRSGGGLGGRIAVGGGGVGLVGLLLYFLLSQLGGGPNSPLPDGLPGLGAGQSVNDTQISQSCRHGSDANTKLDCEVVAVDNSLDAYWAGSLARASQAAPDHLFQRRSQHRLRRSHLRRRPVLLPNR